MRTIATKPYIFLVAVLCPLLLMGAVTTINLATQAKGILPSVSHPALTGDVTNTAGTVATKVVALNNTNLASLGQGILKQNTLGVPSLASPGVDYAGLGSQNVFYLQQLFQVPWGATPGSSVVLASSGTISLANATALVAPTAAVSGVIIPVGTFSGETLVVANNSAFTITFAAATTSHVVDGVSDVIPAQSAREFIYVAGVWFRKA